VYVQNSIPDWKKTKASSAFQHAETYPKYVQLRDNITSEPRRASDTVSTQEESPSPRPFGKI